jgi:carbamoyl-phosphate synthase large subunit
VHSGDSACSLPPFSLMAALQEELRRQTIVMAKALRVVGLMNVQFAIQQDGERTPLVYVLEVNPRASRTVPYVSKATGRPLAKIAARCMAGRTLAEQGVAGEVVPGYFCVKEAVFPFIKFPGVDTILGPEMKSTGEVMGVGETFAEAFLKSQLAAGVKLPRSGCVFLSIKDADKPAVIGVARSLHALGYEIVATRGTAAALAAAGVAVRSVNKVKEGRPHVVDMLVNDEIALVVNTVEEKRSSIQDSYAIRRAALTGQVPTFTTIAGARAAVMGMAQMRDLVAYPLQALHRTL